MVSAQYILVVEDDQDIRESLAEILREEGHRVITAENGQVALQTLTSEDNRPALVFLDLMMPIMDGWQVLDEMQKQSDLRDIPVCIVSAFSARAPTQVISVLPKPVDVNAFLALAKKHSPAP